MEQEQLSIAANQINEGYSLGERHQLGQLQGEYYVTYTHEDVRRYRFLIFIYGLMFIYIMGVLGGFTYTLLSLGTSHAVFPGYFFPMLMNPFLILYGNAQRRKWGNRPSISPRNRHLRVYVYQYGLIKQTNEKSEVIRWSDLYNMKYVPLQPPDPQKPSNTAVPRAGIKLILRHHHRVNLNGALRNLDKLAQQINGRNLANKKAIARPHY